LFGVLSFKHADIVVLVARDFNCATIVCTKHDGPAHVLSQLCDACLIKV
jgi:hypothetical protein